MICLNKKDSLQENFDDLVRKLGKDTVESLLLLLSSSSKILKRWESCELDPKKLYQTVFLRRSYDNHTVYSVIKSESQMHKNISYYYDTYKPFKSAKEAMDSYDEYLKEKGFILL